MLDKNPFKNKVEFCLPNELDKNICLSDFYGNNVVLFLTGTWCGPCKKMEPFLAEIAKEYRPSIDAEKRDHLLNGWAKAIKASIGWTQ